MNALAISAIVFGCVFGAALLGFWLRTVVPPEHLGSDSKDLIKLGMGAIATMSALVLGLLVASAKSSYDADSQGLAEMSANVVLLDRMLAHYGPQAQEARVLLKVVIADTIERIWPKADSHPPPLGPSGSRADVLYYEIEQLAPKSDAQRGLQTQVLALTTEIAQTRLLMIGHSYGSIAGPLLVVVVFCVALTFASFGLQSAPNPTIVVSLMLAALAVSAVTFLILGMYTPFGGLMPLSSAPLQWALSQLGE